MVRAAFVQGQLTASATPASGQPQAIWTGLFDSTHALTAVWPSAQGGENAYNVYRATGAAGSFTQIATGIVPDVAGAGGRKATPYYLDSGLTPSTLYRYYWTAVAGGVESGPTAIVSVTTLAGATNGSFTTPTPPIEPATYLVPPPAAGSLRNVPAGNTLWLASVNSTQGTTGGTSSANAGGGTTVTGCDPQYALAHANLSGGDVIVLSSGKTYNWTLAVPAFTGATGPFVNIVSDQSPEYAGSAGTLITYAPATGPQDYTPFALTAGPASGATTAVLAVAWATRTAYLPVRFTPATAGALIETRHTLFTQGSASIQWATALTVAATTTLDVHVGSYVTPWDANLVPFATNAAPSMPVLQFDSTHANGFGISFATATKYVRFIGIAISPQPGLATTLFYCMFQQQGATPAESIYVDRCLMGMDSSLWSSTVTSTSLSFVRHGVHFNCSHGLLSQSFIYGIADNGNGAGLPSADANAVFTLGGGPLCLQGNYLEAQAETFLAGGGAIAQGNLPNNILSQGNFYHKPTQWQANGMGYGTKNHLEFKAGQYFLSRGDLFQNNWNGYGSQGQHARCFVLGARDSNPGAGWGPQNGPGPYAVTSVSGNVVTYTGAAFASGASLWITGVPGVTAVVAIATAPSTLVSGTTYTVPVNQGLGTSTGAGGSITPTWYGQSPWVYVADVTIQNPKVYECGALAYCFTGDPSVTAYTARVLIDNPLAVIDPGICLYPGHTIAQIADEQLRGIDLTGGVADLTVRNPTILMNAANPNVLNHAFDSSFFWEGLGTGNYATLDRTTIINALLDGAYAVNKTNTSGSAGINALFTNATWNKNLPFLDANSFAAAGTNGNSIGTTFPKTAYASVGFSVWPGSVVPPQVPASNSNITTGTYATASTTGGPLGAKSQGLSDSYPLLYMISNGGTQNQDQGTATAGVSWIQMAACRHGSQPGWWPNWSGPSGGTALSVCQAVKAANVMAVPARILNYYIIQTQFANEGSTGVWTVPYNQFNAAKWWLYNGANSSGSVVQQGNGNVVNVTSFAPVYQSQTMTQWFSAWFAGFNINGVGQAANPYMDGFYMDNYAQNAIATGYWNLTASSGAAEPNPNQWVRTGQAGVVAAMRAAVTTANVFITGNVATSSQSGSVITGLTGTLDFALSESLSGQSYSLETLAWSTALASVQKALTMCTGRANSGVVWHADGITLSTGQDYASALRGDPNWQGVRYTIGAAMVLGCYYCPTSNGGYGSTQQFNLDVMNKGKGLTSTVGYEYLGQPLSTAQGAVQTGPWQTISGSQIYRRDFANGIVLVRIPQNSPVTTANTTSVTVTAAMLGGQTYHLFTSTQDSTFNGGTATSWTFARDRDAIILLNAPA